MFTNHATIETNNDLGAGTLRIVGSAYGGSFDNEDSVFADNGGTIELGDWAGLGRSSTIINNNTIEALSDGSATNIEIAGNVTIQGSGQILFGGSRPDDDVIVSNGLSATLNLDGGTLSGAGNLGDAHLTLNIEAGTTVKATGPFFDINTGANTVTNAGLIIVSADGGLSIQSAVQNTGTVLATSPDGSLSFVAQGNTNGPTGVILALGGNIGLFGSITNNGGLIQVGNGGEIIVIFRHSRPQRRPDRNRQRRITGPAPIRHGLAGGQIHWRRRDSRSLIRMPSVRSAPTSQASLSPTASIWAF